MRKLVFTFMLILIGHWNCFSQTVLDTDELNNLDNVFLYSLKRYCESLDSLKVKTVFVKDGEHIGQIWPKKIKSFEIKYLGYFDYRKVIRENDGNVTMVGIGPLQYRKGKFYVDVIPFSTTYSKRAVHFSNGGGLTVYFEYDKERKGLIYKTEEWGGI
ncbi:hypothetical protein SAMN05444377_1235 [Flavobacterium fontis]|uniref:Uncharacterized protein n=1 Tax=Flavobacterium fontis TaxID=1124188 RepID=A0A1M5EWM2_9FLAO|nr:hypothetical protein [Flavobacterium fontis]SHF83577.1 hypothetical protein SAMN05444377_1235 [Flavobacterium fontis]